MPWERGEQSLEVEMSRIQSWIEMIDPEIRGNGKPGMLQDIQEIKGSQMRSEGMIEGGVKVLRVIAWLIATGIAALGLWLGSLEFRHAIHTDNFTKQSSSQDAGTGLPLNEEEHPDGAK